MLVDAILSYNKPKKKVIDLTGKIFNSGSIIIGYLGIKNNRASWLVLCKCKKEYIAISYLFSNNKGDLCDSCCRSRSYIKKKYIGEKFGNGCTIIKEVDRKSKKNNRRFIVKCHCKEKWEIPASSIYKTKECWKCAHKTSSIKISGENSILFNPNLTEEERNEKRYSSNKIAKKFRKENPLCEKCGSKADCVHHKNGWNLFPKERTDTKNLSSLCNLCHENFHKIYGYGNNTKEQFNSWIK